MRVLKLWYLASPYSDPDLYVREERFRNVCEVAGTLMAHGLQIFSPIAHTHSIACECELPKGWDFWQAYDETMLSRCDGMIVLMLPGWQESKGISAELALAENLGKPVHYLKYPFTQLQEAPEALWSEESGSGPRSCLA